MRDSLPEWAIEAFADDPSDDARAVLARMLLEARADLRDAEAEIAELERALSLSGRVNRRLATWFFGQGTRGYE